MKPTLNLSRRGRRVPAPPPPPTSPPADRSELPERLPIPSSFVDDLLCRLQQDEQEEEEEDDDDDDDIDTSNDDDGTMTKSPAPPSTSQQQQHPALLHHHQVSGEKENTAVAYAAKDAKKAMLRQQLQQCKVELLQQHQPPPATPATVKVTAPPTTACPSDKLRSIVDKVFRQRIDQNKNDDSFVKSCTILEFYDLVQQQYLSNHQQQHHRGDDPSRPRVRRTVVLTKEMKSIIKERLQYLILQQQQQPALTNTGKTLASTTIEITKHDNKCHWVNEPPSLVKPPSPQPQLQLPHPPQQGMVSTMTSSTVTEHCHSVPPPPPPPNTTMEHRDTKSIPTKRIVNGHGNRFNVTDHDAPSTVTEAPLPVVPTKGRRARLPKPTKKKAMSLNDECKMIVESVKQRSHVRQPDTMDTHSMIGTTTTTTKTTITSDGSTRKRKSTCPLCKKCPCQLKKPSDDAFDDRTNVKKKKMDLTSFCQSDAATEKMLLQKLQTYQVTTDQYEEQTESIRRLLKKHRRQMYQKRQALLQQYDHQYHHHGPHAAASRFLPDVVDDVPFQQDLNDAHHHHPTNRTSTDVISSIHVDHRNVPMPPTAHTRDLNCQPTLTQMMGSTTATATTTTTDDDVNNNNKHKHDNNTIVNGSAFPDGHEGMTTTTNDPDRQSIDDHTSHPTVLDHSGDHDDVMAVIAPHIAKPPPRAHRVESTLVSSLPPTDPLVASPCVPASKDSGCHNHNDIPHYQNGSSIWDSFRYGVYDSSWDQWFAHATETSVDENMAVNHLLQLFPTSPDVVVGKKSSPICPPTPPSHLSNRAEEMVDHMVSNVCSNPLQLSAIEQINPNWKENIRYALGQNDELTIQDALSNVRTAKEKLRSIKECILANIDRQQMVLDVYDETLQAAQSRLCNAFPLTSPTRPGGTCRFDDAIPPATQGFFLSPHINGHTDNFKIVDNDDADVQRFDRNALVENDITTIFYSNEDDGDDDSGDEVLEENDDHRPNESSIFDT